MEPVSTTIMASAVVGYLAKMFSDSKSFKDFTNEFSSAVVSWLKPLFLKEDEKTPKEVIEKLQKTPDSKPKQSAVISHIESDLEDNPDNISFIKEMYSVLKDKEKKGEAITIINSRNIALGDVNAGGSVIFGDNSSISNDGKKQGT